MQKGRLVVVGTGIQLGRHLTRRALSEIETAEVVLCMTDGHTYKWLEGIRPDLIGLHAFYGKDKDRRQTYREMDAAIMAQVRAGKRVCLVLYGHPGVFADVPHVVMAKARSEGAAVRMEAGVSADACLYADLGIDPGGAGLQAYESTQFMINERPLDPSALLILWQVALSGDLSCRRFGATPAYLALLVEKLQRWYPPEHPVILYEAARIAVQTHRADRLRLADLPNAHYREYTTLVIPPARELEPDLAMQTALERLQSH